MYCLSIAPHDPTTRYLADPTLGTVRRLTTQPLPTRIATMGVSPDGVWTVYTVRPDCDGAAGKPCPYWLMAESRTTGEAVTLEANILSSNAVWSPDDKLLYVVWRADGQPDVVMMRFASDGERTVIRQRTFGTPRNALIELLGWSADGGWAAFTFVQGNVVHLHFWSADDARTAETEIAWPIDNRGLPDPNADAFGHPLPPDVSGAWSPQEWWLALNGHDVLKLYQFDALTMTLTEQHHLDTRHRGSVDDVAQALVWSPDGRYVGRYTPGEFDGAFDAYRDLIDVVGVDGSTYTDITQGGDYLSFGELEWLPTGAAILFGKVITPGRYDIYAYDVPSRTYTLLISAMEIFYSGGFGPPSPNVGLLWLVKQVDAGATGTMYAISLYWRDERRRIPIVANAAEVLLATFTQPPTERVVVVWQDAAGQVHTQVSDIRGTILHEWTAIEWGSWQWWGFRQAVLSTNGGSVLLFLLQRTVGDIVEKWVERVDLLTGERSILLDAAQVKQATTGNAPLSSTLATGIAPDGASVAYVVPNPHGDAGRLSIVTGGQVYRLPRTPQLVRWSPDGRWLLIQYERSSALSYPIHKPRYVLEILRGISDEPTSSAMGRGEVGDTVLRFESDDLRLQSNWIACADV